jgi:hypothetical protein
MQPDDVTKEPPAQAQGTDAPPAAESQRPLTLDDLKDFRNSVLADARRLAEGIAKPKGGRGKDAPAEPQGEPDGGYQAAIRREREISEAFEDVGGLTREARGILRKLVDAEKPENVAEFIASHAKAFGKSPGTAATTTPPRPAAAIDSAPVSDAGSPAASTTFTDDTPLWRLKPEDRDHLIRMKGHGWYADTLRKQLKGQRFTIRR